MQQGPWDKEDLLAEPVGTGIQDKRGDKRSPCLAPG